VPLIFDFDDAIFHPSVSEANKHLSWLKFRTKTREICQIASHVTVGNSYLESYARQVNDNVSVIPSTIDTQHYVMGEPSSAEPPVIGWTGSITTIPYLDIVKPALQRLAKQEEFVFRFIGPINYDYQIEGVQVESLPWKSITEVEDLKPLSIGLMPLPDNPWTRGKCSMKALQYMGLGIPVVCSPVGMNADLIQDGENGFLAGTDDEWVEKLARLLRHSELRERVGRTGRLSVEKEYSAAHQAQRLSEILKSIR
jgi:glycosyltransferase involved in cell wall biosynthesis